MDVYAWVSVFVHGVCVLMGVYVYVFVCGIFVYVHVCEVCVCDLQAHAAEIWIIYHTLLAKVKPGGP